MGLVVSFIHSLDPHPIMTAAEKARKRILYQFGGYVLRTAKRSIRPASAKRDTSQEGEAPVGHGNQVYKNMLAFAVTPDEVVIGGELWPSSRGTGKVPRTIEYGGQEDILVDDKGRRKTVTYKERPAVRLAYHKAIAKFLPELMKNSITP